MPRTLATHPCSTALLFRMMTLVWVATLIASPPAAAQQRNLFLLGCHYSTTHNELILALTSRTERMDPTIRDSKSGKIRANDFRTRLEIQLGPDEDAVIENHHIKVWVLEELVGQYTFDTPLFRFNIVIDESSSIDDESLRMIRGFVRTFLGKIPVAFEAQLIRFSDTVDVMTGFTADRSKLLAALKRKRLTGQTALYDALDQSVLELSQSKGDIPLRLTIAFTDGKNNASQRFESFKEFKNKIHGMTRQTGILVYLAGVGPTVESAQLEQIPAGLGHYERLGDLREIEGMLSVVEEQLKKTYVVSAQVSSRFKGMRKIFILKRIAGDRRETVQDLELPAHCVVG